MTSLGKFDAHLRSGIESNLLLGNGSAVLLPATFPVPVIGRQVIPVPGILRIFSHETAHVSGFDVSPRESPILAQVLPFGKGQGVAKPRLDVVPEAQLTLFIFGTGHVIRIEYPPFPDRSHSRPIDRALSLKGIGRVRRLPFTFGARFTGPLFRVELTVYGCH